MLVVPNPEVVQAEDWRNPDSPTDTTPVFLLHDGGGTTFAYHCLSPLHRPVYGIHNPYFRSGQLFNGGLPQMARLYATWIRRTVAADTFPCKRRNRDGTASVLLGGWSLGGYLSLEIARRLADDPHVRIVGILMVDSVYPFPGGADRKDTSSSSSSTTSWAGTPLDGFDLAARASASAGAGAGDGGGYHDGDTGTEASARETNMALSRRCMAHAMHMVARWDMPRWAGALAGRRPRTILLRAKQPVPTPDGRPKLGLDRYRGERGLGWDAYAEDLFEEVVDIEGHHFEVFAPQNIEGVSGSMRRALDKLDAMAKDG